MRFCTFPHPIHWYLFYSFSQTIGDCYVAVCGLPTPNQDHAIAMCRFAVECREKFKELRCKLETKLGPDTGDLDLR